MKSFWLYGALILVLLLMPAAPILGEICLALEDCPTVDAVQGDPHADDNAQTGNVEASSMGEDHCGETVAPESPEPGQTVACGAVLECCDSAPSQPVALVERQEAWPNHSLGALNLSAEATAVSLDKDTWRSVPKVPPLEHQPPLFTLNSSLLL